MPRVPFAECVIVDTGELCGDIDVDVEGYVDYDAETETYDILITDVTGCLFYVGREATVDDKGLKVSKRKSMQIDISAVIADSRQFIERLESQVIESHPQGRG